jgi:L-lactate dehydrogenase complex protein LldG
MVAHAVAEVARSSQLNEGVPAHVVVWQDELIGSLKLEDVFASEAPKIKIHHFANDQIIGETERQRAKGLAATAICGITTADWCIAESATLVMRTRPGQGRAVSLLPPIHIAVIPLASLISDLSELYTELGLAKKDGYHGLTNCMTFVSGPSTTRDIESIAVSGAHGPREVHIVVIS